MVNAIDWGRFPEAKKELDALLTLDELTDVPFLLLGNKIDMHSAALEEELKYALGLLDTYGKVMKPDKNSGVRPIEVYMCSVVRRMGYKDGFVDLCGCRNFFLNLSATVPDCTSAKCSVPCVLVKKSTK